MSIWICPKCNTVYKSDLLSPVIENGDVTYYCPNANCNYTELFEVDELMARPIYILNKKGYKTRFCCSGHSYDSYYVDDYPYILFDKLYKFPNLPTKWLQEFLEDPIVSHNTITRLYVTTQWAHKDKYIYMRNLEHWVDNLDNYIEKKEK